MHNRFLVKKFSRKRGKMSCRLGCSKKRPESALYRTLCPNPCLHSIQYQKISKNKEPKEQNKKTTAKKTNAVVYLTRGIFVFFRMVFPIS